MRGRRKVHRDKMSEAGQMYPLNRVVTLSLIDPAMNYIEDMSTRQERRSADWIRDAIWEKIERDHAAVHPEIHPAFVGFKKPPPTEPDDL